MEGDAAGEVARPGHPRREGDRPGHAFLAVDAERPARRPPAGARRDVEHPLDAVVDDLEGDLAPEQDLDPPSWPAERRLGTRRAQERGGDARVERPRSREPRPLLEGEHRDGGLLAGLPRHAGGRHETEVDEELLDVAQAGGSRLGQRLPHRAAQVVAGEQADRDAALDPDPDPEHAGHGAQRADELPDPRLQRRLVAARDEPGGEVDGDDLPGDAQVTDRRPRRDRGPDAARPLRLRRPREERSHEPRDARSPALHRNGVRVLEEPHVASEHPRASARRSGEHERGERGRQEQSAPHAPRVQLPDALFLHPPSRRSATRQ